MTSEKKTWSDGLKKQTLEALSLDAPIGPDGIIHLKHSSGKYGSLSCVDLMGDSLKIKVKDSGAVETFYSVEELIEKEWVID
ncbi:MAG: hypothetical protein JJT75_04120 [Opitutales bacterium]|nr:hypothetical protein [Opitutales bacterium]